RASQLVRGDGECGKGAGNSGVWGGGGRRTGGGPPVGGRRERVSAGGHAVGAERHGRRRRQAPSPMRDLPGRSSPSPPMREGDDVVRNAVVVIGSAGRDRTRVSAGRQEASQPWCRT